MTTEQEKKIEDLEAIIIDLQIKLERKSKSGNRKAEVLAVLRSNGPITIQDLSKEISISTKNISSQLTYLRTDGYQIFTDNHGRKFLNENK